MKHLGNVALIILTVAGFGFLLPFLISSHSHEGVAIGVVILILAAYFTAAKSTAYFRKRQDKEKIK